MSEKRRQKTNQPHQNIKSAQRRYKFWIIGVVLVVTLIAIAIIAIQAGGNRSTPATTATINPSDIPRISAEAVKAKLDAGVNLVIIDARSEAEYEQTRIAGAIFIPPGQITQRYEELNAYDEVVTYCT